MKLPVTFARLQTNASAKHGFASLLSTFRPFRHCALHEVELPLQALYLPCSVPATFVCFLVNSTEKLPNRLPEFGRHLSEVDFA